MNKISEKKLENEIKQYLLMGTENFAPTIPSSLKGQSQTASGLMVENAYLKNNWKGKISAQKTFNKIKRNMDYSDYKGGIYSNINNTIQNNLNEIVGNLTDNYNRNASIYNKQSDIINRHKDLVESNTKKLNKQLEDLDKIQEQIALKSRIIELNEEMENRKKMNKEIIIGFFVIIPLLIIPVLFISLRFTNVYIGLLIIILIIIGYIIYVAVIYRRYNKKRYPLYDDKKSDIKGSIKLFFEKERDRLRDELGKSNSCICPEEEDDRSSFREYLGLLPVNMTLSQYQELFRKIGCVRDLNDKDCDKWRKMTSINMVIEDMKNNYKFASKCKGTNEDNEFCFPGRCKKNNLILNVNGPYKYNDGSGVDEQVYPMPIGGIDVEVNGRGYNFPNEMKKLRKLENPFKRILFEIWLMSLHSSGIKMNDPRLKNKLNLLELEVTENAPEPYWREVKLPLVDNMDTNIKKVCQKYNSERKDLGSGPGKFLADTWHFFYQESIPTNIYEKWLKQINISIKNNDDISGVYESFLNEIIESDKFKRKFDNIDNFVMLKLKELISVLGNSFDASEPDSVEFL